jgi:hypothetical protein
MLPVIHTGFALQSELTFLTKTVNGGIERNVVYNSCFCSRCTCGILNYAKDGIMRNSRTRWRSLAT